MADLFRPASRRRLAALLAGCIALFAVLAVLVSTGRAAWLDAQAHAALYDVLGAQRLDVVWGITWLGNSDTITVAVVVVSLVLLGARRPWLVARLVAASGGGGIVSLGLKQGFQRARPVEQVVAAMGFSFPSGHATASSVFYGMMIFLAWQLSRRASVRRGAAVVFVLVVAAVGLSRVYLNVHFLSDVMAGWAAGTAWLATVLLVADVMERRWPA